MATQQTRLTQSSLAQLSNRHEEVAGQITSQQTSLASSIDMLAGANRGDMMTSLKNVHQQWDQACRDIVKNLERMAQEVNRTGRETQDQDSVTAQEIGRVQTPGLSSFMS
ncbi:WXG100 family type VII secretion target [Actinopolyspora lacussalsi]|uniref:WXG100 family type VII secretion target n=1 Tax=Actinopolyspora righensis TaxID=995060 RepID=A0A1I6XB53_9ACTN|nr:WXG100 family type VII secretion target [Actinopolyspora righensis]MDP9641358.1 WXG100 family type VII secretion target [Actinopolyspora lacussalsi]SFT35343.1 WXG100 family type VII secretion target [Actinopolyspora righensis]